MRKRDGGTMNIEARKRVVQVASVINKQEMKDGQVRTRSQV